MLNFIESRSEYCKNEKKTSGETSKSAFHKNHTYEEPSISE
jgi:hypothetical protein